MHIERSLMNILKDWLKILWTSASAKLQEASQEQQQCLIAIRGYILTYLDQGKFCYNQGSEHLTALSELFVVKQMQ